MGNYSMGFLWCHLSSHTTFPLAFAKSRAAKSRRGCWEILIFRRGRQLPFIPTSQANWLGSRHIGEDGYGGVEDAGSDVENDAEFSIPRASIKIFGSH